MENKVKYLEIIQGVISRMANNSFLMKGWAANSAKTACRFRKSGMLFRFARHGVTLCKRVIRFSAYHGHCTPSDTLWPSSCSSMHLHMCCP